MKYILNTKNLLCCAALATTFFTANFVDASCVKCERICPPTIEQSLGDYVEGYPYLGLVMDKVPYGPITVKDVRLNGHDRVAIVSPGETVEGQLKYKIDSDQLQSLHLHHIIVGLKNEGAQDCITHSLGVWDSKGKATFELKAPEKKGVYEVRFCYAQALTCKDARETWVESDGQPSSKATMGILIVK